MALNKEGFQGVHESAVAMVIAALCIGLVTWNLPLLSDPGLELGNLVAIILSLFALVYGCQHAGTQKILSQTQDTQRLPTQLTVMLLSSCLAIASGTHFGAYDATCAPGRSWFVAFVAATPPIFIWCLVGNLLRTLFKGLFLSMTVGLLVFLAGLALGLFQLYWDPQFRFYSIAYVIFEQTPIQPSAATWRFWVWRSLSLLLSLGLHLVVQDRAGSQSTLLDTGHGTQGYGTYRRARGRLILVGLTILLMVIGGLYIARPESPSRLEVFAAKEGLVSFRSEHFVVRAASKSLTVESLQGVGIEAEFWAYEHLTTLGLDPDDDAFWSQAESHPYTIWVYATEHEMTRWTGAQNTNFSLPHHGVIHLRGTQTPNDVLGHEVFHLVAAKALGGGLFGVPSVYGAIPHPVLTEGITTALSPTNWRGGDFSLFEKAAALRELDLGPKIESLLVAGPLSFVTADQSLAYIQVGAFFQALWLDKGFSAFQSISRSGSLDSAFSSRQEKREYIEAFIKKMEDSKHSEVLMAQFRNKTSGRSAVESTCEDRRQRLQRADKDKAYGQGKASSRSTTVSLRQRQAGWARDLKGATNPSIRRSAIAKTIFAETILSHGNSESEGLPTVSSSTAQHNDGLNRTKVRSSDFNALDCARSGLRYLIHSNSTPVMVSFMAQHKDKDFSKALDPACILEEYLFARRLALLGDNSSALRQSLLVWPHLQDLPPEFGDALQDMIAQLHAARHDSSIARIALTQLRDQGVSARLRNRYHEMIRRIDFAEKKDLPTDALLSYKRKSLR